MSGAARRVRLQGPRSLRPPAGTPSPSPSRRRAHSRPARCASALSGSRPAETSQLGDGVATAIRRYGPRWPWRSVAPVLRAADVAVVNLEMCVSRRGPACRARSSPSGASRAGSAPQRTIAGIDVGSLANNHSLDYGRAAFLDTLSNAHRFGIRTIGGGRDDPQGSTPRDSDAEAASASPSSASPTSVRSASTPGRPPGRNSRIRARRPRGRPRCATPGARRGRLLPLGHRAGPPTPTRQAKHLARVALRAGATVVLGAHPHVLQPVRRSGSRFVAWSLGNFVFPPGIPPARIARGSCASASGGAASSPRHSCGRASTGCSPDL